MNTRLFPNLGRRLGIGLFALAASATSLAQDFPNRPIRLVATFSPGSTVDIVARAIAQPMSQVLGKPVVVENKPGAGGGLGIDMVARSSKDGYTIAMGTSASMAINPSLPRGTPYNPVTDLEPIGLIALVPNILVAGPSVPGDTLKQIVEYAKARPGQLNYASSGVGTTNHLLGELLQAQAGVQLVHMPYKGNQDSISDLLAGRVQLMFSGLPPIQGLLQQGKLRAIAVGGKTRMAALPDTPTMVEAGLTQLEAVSTFTLVGPAGMPREAVDKINAAATKALASPEVRARLQGLGMDPAAATPEQTATLIANDLRFWSKQIKALNLKEE